MMRVLQVMGIQNWAIENLLNLIRGEGFQIDQHVVTEDGAAIPWGAGYDVVHFGFWANLPYGGERPIGAVVTVQHIEESARKDLAQRLRVFRPEQVVSACPITQEIVKEEGFESEVIPSAVPEQPFRVGYLGLEQPLKRFDVIDEACRRAGVTNVGIRCQTPKPVLEGEDLYDWYRSLSVYVVASECEGGPLPPLEALSVGTPVISTRVGIMPETEGVKYFDGTVGDLVDKLESFKPKLPITVDEYSQKYLDIYRRASSGYGC